MPVLVNRESILLEVSHETLLVIENGGVEDNLFDLFLEDESTAVASFGSLPRALRCCLLGTLRCSLAS
jgi:hypothetical protein